VRFRRHKWIEDNLGDDAGWKSECKSWSNKRDCLHGCYKRDLLSAVVFLSFSQFQYKASADLLKRIIFTFVRYGGRMYERLAVLVGGSKRHSMHPNHLTHR
jgi:hypothetical protein